MSSQGTRIVGDADGLKRVPTIPWIAYPQGYAIQGIVRLAHCPASNIGQFLAIIRQSKNSITCTLTIKFLCCIILLSTRFTKVFQGVIFLRC